LADDGMEDNEDYEGDSGSGGEDDDLEMALYNETTE